MKTPALALLLILSLAMSSNADNQLQPEAPLPEVQAPDHDGTPVNLADFKDKEWLLIFFYPKASTPGCTAQSCSLRDAYETLQSKGVEVIGVSTDSPASQKAFKEKYSLPYTLLADSDQKVLKAFGVPTMLGMASRQAFLFHKGKLVWRDLKASTKKQADDVLAILNKSGKP